MQQEKDLEGLEESSSNKKRKTVQEEKKFSCKISKTTIVKRKHKPSSMNRTAKDRRRHETVEISSAIHGVSKENPCPVIFGMLDTMCAKFPSKMVAENMLKTKPSVVKVITDNAVKMWNTQFYNSIDNILRSLNIFYSHNVMGKSKYIAIRKANKNCEHTQNSVVNYIQYPLLATTINNIDIGTLHDLHPTLTLGDENKIVSGNYRSCDEYLLRLAEFYLKVNRYRFDKLAVFEKFQKKDAESLLFVFAIGGDGAPICGMSFLVSFPFQYKKRISDVKKVEAKRKEIEAKSKEMQQQNTTT